MRSATLLFFAVVFVFAGVAGAQTNLGISGGALLPLGDFEEATDISPYVGARYEIQDVNALGQVAVLSYLIQGGFAFLQTDSRLETILDAAGNKDDGYYFEGGVGARVYSRANALFVGAGVAFVNYDMAGAAEAKTGFGGHIGIGFKINRNSFLIELEGRINVGLLEGGDDIEHFLVLANLGLPF